GRPGVAAPGAAGRRQPGVAALGTAGGRRPATRTRAGPGGYRADRKRGPAPPADPGAGAGDPHHVRGVAGLAARRAGDPVADQAGGAPAGRAPRVDPAPAGRGTQEGERGGPGPYRPAGRPGVPVRAGARRVSGTGPGRPARVAALRLRTPPDGASDRSGGSTLLCGSLAVPPAIVVPLNGASWPS